MNIKTLAITAASTLLLGSSLSVVADNVGTELTGLQLPVMINQTGAYVEAQKNMAVYPGDRLMVMGGGSAQIQYANGCVQTVEANEILQVGTPESCSAIDTASINNQMGAAPGVGGGAGAATGVLGTNLGAGTLAVTAAAGVGVVAKGADYDGNGATLTPISR
ncbi:hypothetical protein [Candidatus Marimicrobium litorale]|uniref:Uncharacterized protein n=1 Tax=Candidatus Marimicrobium litorale TaxID=2518991 RepID=A0ABT3T5H2_9GAMM|nr:hypothetical protein [Candidatus Marimicrobium litorale]MCX2977415.1 hypothetical protein [Candidatus Marimicrobium litorale]